MAKKAKVSQVRLASTQRPTYPYSITPNSLRRLLDKITESPKPDKLNAQKLKAWGFANTNDQSVLRVLKTLDLLNGSNEPTQNYIDYMQQSNGPAALGRQIQKTYAELFKTLPKPETASNDDLKNFFNSFGGGGSDAVVQYQIQTFKALAEHATFGASDALAGSNPSMVETDAGIILKNSSNKGGPAIHINVHIHFPEGKSKADYDAMIDRIGDAIYKDRD